MRREAAFKHSWGCQDGGQTILITPVTTASWEEQKLLLTEEN